MLLLLLYVNPKEGATTQALSYSPKPNTEKETRNADCNREATTHNVFTKPIFMLMLIRKKGTTFTNPMLKARADILGAASGEH